MMRFCIQNIALNLIRRTTTLGIIFLMLCHIQIAEANTEADVSKTTIGAYVNGIHSIDLKTGTVDLDLYVWLRSNGKRNLLDSLEVMNGSIKERSAVVSRKVGVENYYSMRIAVTAFQHYELSKFPLDKQTLKIYFEDAEEDNTLMQFIPDEVNTKIGKSVTLPGWKIGNPRISVRPNGYDTNYGDTSMGIDSSSYSRATLEIPIDREGVGFFFKLFSTVFLSAGVAFLSFYIRPINLDPRFGLGVGGIFAVVASNFVLSSMLPETHEITMGEALLITTIASIFLALLESVVSLKLWESGRMKESERVDYFAGRVLPIVYLFLCTTVITLYVF